MKENDYIDITKELLGEDLYYELLKEISKEHRDTDLVDFGKEVMNKCCLLIITLGTSNIKLDNVKLCLSGKVIEISCKELANKYKTYTNKILKNTQDILR